MRIVFPKVLIELKPSRIDGVGVFAVAVLQLGEQIADGIEESDYRRLISWKHFHEYDADVRKKIAEFCIGTPDGFIPPEKLDFNHLSVEWYLNHSCDGNIGFSENGAFVARRRVDKSEELTYDYALAESNPHFRMDCKCANPNCRRLITGNDWKNVEFREKNIDYMLPRLRPSSNEGQHMHRSVARRH